MRTLFLALSLVLSSSVAAAEFEYVVPLAGYAEGSGRTWYYAQAFVRNLSPRTAELRVTGLYPAAHDAHCGLAESVTLAPYEQIATGLTVCRGQFAAFSFTSSEKLNIRVEIDSHVTMKAGWDKQVLDASSGWLPAAVDLVADGIAKRTLQRANILLVNPSDRLLTVLMHVERPEWDVESDVILEVPARSSRLFPLTELAHPAPPPFIDSADGRHLIRLRGDGPLQGGVSTISGDGASMYVPLVALEP